MGKYTWLHNNIEELPMSDTVKLDELKLLFDQVMMNKSCYVITYKRSFNLDMTYTLLWSHTDDQIILMFWLHYDDYFYGQSMIT